MRRSSAGGFSGFVIGALILCAGPVHATMPVTDHGRTAVTLPAAKSQWKSGELRRDTGGRLVLDRDAAGAPVAALHADDCEPEPRAAVLERAPQWLTSLVESLAPKYDLAPRLVLAVIAVESNFDVKAVSPKRAQGLMQLIPETADRFGVRNPFDPADNIRGGIQYLRWLLEYFGGDLSLALAGYNAGEKAVERHQGIPPYAETVAYVKKVKALVGCERPRSASLVSSFGASTVDHGAAPADGAWPPVQKPYDLWSAAVSAVRGPATTDCRGGGAGYGPNGFQPPGDMPAPHGSRICR